MTFLGIGCACLASFLLQQPGIPPASAAFHVDELEARLVDPSAYVSFLDVPTLRAGIYRLERGATDEQTPHSRDEIYHVLSGKAVLDVAGRRYEATPGAILFVAAQTEHHFVDIEETLTTLVFFADQVPTTGGMIRGPTPLKQTPYPETSPRGSTRIFYWFTGSAGQVAIDHGLPRWQPAYARFFNAPGAPRWRFGQDFWTRLDTNIELTMGGVKVPAGEYYLVLEHDATAGLRIIALDPAPIRKAKLDAYQAPQTTGGIAIPLRRDEDVETFAERLALRLDVVDRERGTATLTIDFGPARFVTDVVLHPST
jgi:hypothetical protein